MILAPNSNNVMNGSGMRTTPWEPAYTREVLPAPWVTNGARTLWCVQTQAHYKATLPLTAHKPAKNLV